MNSKAFHDNFRDCFSRSESRDHFYNYMVGQFSTLERKSIEPIALAVENGNIRPMQHFISKVSGMTIEYYTSIVIW